MAYLDSRNGTSDKIRIFHSMHNRGTSGGRNDGIERARGEWICFLDRDDWWEREYLAELVNVANDIDLVQLGY